MFSVEDEDVGLITLGENRKNKTNNENQRKTKQKTGNDNETQGILKFVKGTT